MTGQKIRALVVEVSPSVRRYIIDTLSCDSEFDVVGEAASGAEAIRLCESLRPDVITLDMVLADGMSGLQVTEHVMAYCPTPILIVSSSKQGSQTSTFDALARGAVDTIDKPRASEDPAAWERKFKQTLKTVSRIKVITHLGGRRCAASSPRLPAPRQCSNTGTRGRYELVVLGASTGGPGAALKILRSLSPTFPLPILLVIHVGQTVSIALADWLANAAGVPVTEARDGEELHRARALRVILAPPDRHLALQGNRLVLDRGPERHGCRPAIDVLFESVAEQRGRAVIACLLTGMGRDGAAGMLAIKKAGGMTIAQDESSSVVFGMPREAIRLGAAERVLHLEQVGPTLTSLANGRAA